MLARTRIRSEDVRLQGQHILFVEGSDKESVDPKVLNELFSRRVRIEPLGPSFSVGSVAEALQPNHPTYYFLIDRDHYDGSFIDKCWNNFSDPDTNNLLIWRRREIENYFLDPKYLCDRSTVSRYARYVIRSFVAWGVLKDAEAKGCYEKLVPMNLADHNLVMLMFEAVLHTTPEGQGVLSLLLNHPAFFPFHLSVMTGASIAQHSDRIEVVRYGLDDEMLKMRTALRHG